MEDSAALGDFLRSRRGSPVHVAGEAARFPDTPLVDYAAAKTALLSLSRSLAAEFGPRGIRSNVVSSGPTRTRLWDAPGGFADQLAAQFSLPVQEAVEHFVRDVRGLPTGRLGTPEEVANVIAYLLSPLAVQVTGAEWAIDGGALRQIRPVRSLATQMPSVPSLIPRPWATRAIGLPVSGTIRTAPARNSGSNFRLVSAIRPFQRGQASTLRGEPQGVPKPHGDQHIV